MYKLSESSRKNLEGVDQKLLAVISYALTISLVDFGIPKDGGLRTAERQRELFKEGVTQLDGFERKSRHQSGKAFDVFAYVDGKASWDQLHLSMVANAILQSASALGVELEWGGLWKKFRDMPHFELVE